MRIMIYHMRKRTALKPSALNNQKTDVPPAADEKDRTALHCLLICCIALTIYIPLIHGNPWSGNEPTRIAVAQDMLRTGNWIVPTLHGKLYLTKPPLMNWLIAASGTVFGGITEWSSRVPSVLAIMATGLVVYLMTRSWLGRDSRLFAALAVISMTGLVKKGMSAEIDALFILFVTGILLVWLNGYSKGWRPVVLWGTSLFLVGVAFLTKGPHAAVFFYFTVAAYLLLRRRLSFFFSWAHGVGLLVAAAVLLVYLSAILQEMPFSAYLDMWKTQIASRGESSRAHGFLKHLAEFPLEAALSFMPWILLALPALHRDIRQHVRKVLDNELAFFSLVMIAANFPLYWLLPNAYVRYILPAGPFIAMVLAALVASYGPVIGQQPQGKALVLKGLRGAAILVCIAAPVIAGAALSKGMRISLPLAASVILIVLSSGILVLKPAVIGFRALAIPVALWVGLFTLLFNDISMQKMVIRGESPRQAAQNIERLMPAGTVRVYEIGYRRILAVSCYLSKEVVELYEFGQLKDIGSEEQVYFLFDTDLLKNLDDEQKASYESMQWEKLGSATFERGDNEIVLGRLNYP